MPAKFSPMVGLVYDIDNHQTAYASYSTIYLPQSGDETFTGKIIDPINGEQFEFGEKGEYFDGRLSTNLALFRITETNRAMSDPAHIGFDIAQGTARSQGVELRVSGEVVQGWTALLSVTNIGDTKYISSLTTGGLGTYYGDPRKVLFTVRATL